MKVIRVKIGYWLLAIGFWRLFSSGFVPAAGMRVRVKVGMRHEARVAASCWFWFLRATNDEFEGEAQG
jgi:hypothetical protein